MKVFALAFSILEQKADCLVVLKVPKCTRGKTHKTEQFILTVSSRL